MNKLRYILLLAALCASAFAADPAPLPANTSDLVHREDKSTAAKYIFTETPEYRALAKERDDLKARVDQLTGQNQYLQILAERNELAVRVVQMELERAKGELAGAVARAAQLQADVNAAQSPKPATSKHEEKK